MQKNNLSFSPTSDNALLASKQGKLGEWAYQLLMNEGNIDLAKLISSEKTVAVKMFEFPLSQLKRIEGPEEKEDHRLSPDVWEKNVENLTKKIKEGYQPAPLIVTDFWNHFELADGNHRHEALIRTGKTHYWTIFFIKYEKGKEYLKTILKN